MASFRKLKNGNCQATIYCGLDADGKQIREYITMPTKRECKIAAAERELEIEENGLDNVGNMRFSVWAEKWLSLKKSDLSPSTYKTYKMYINHHFKPYFGEKKLNKINDLHVKEYISYKLVDLDKITVRKHFFALSDIFKTALKNKSPMSCMKPPKTKRKKVKLPPIADFELIFNAVENHFDELPVLLAAWCGLREGEIFALKKDDINWKEKKIRIDENKAISEEGYILKDPKSDNGIREIVVAERIMYLLKKRCLETTDIDLFKMRPDSYGRRFHNLLLVHNQEIERRAKERDPLPRRNKNALINQLNIQDRSLPIVRFHDLRHLHASDLYRAGVPDQYAADRLGHDIKVLKGIYQHLQLEDQVEIDATVRDIYDKKR